MYAIVQACADSQGAIVVYPDVASEVPASKVVWWRATLHHNIGGQGSLAGDTGVKRWRRSGVMVVQVFAPIGGGMVQAYESAESLVRELQASSGCVWLRNVRLNEIGADGAFEQINVLADFTYDDVR